MKRIGLLLILLAFTIGAVVRFGQQNKTTENSEIINNGEIASQDMFTVIVASGDVYHGKDGNSYTKINGEEAELPNLTYVQTKEGEAEIILANNSVITLDTNTTIRVDSTSKRTTIKQLYGNTWHRVQDIAKIGEYEVETDNTLAGVRGTIFGVNVDQNTKETSVFVVEHSVEVTKGEKQADNSWKVYNKKLVQEEKEVFVSNNKDEKLALNNTRSELVRSNWYQENRQKDEELRGKENTFVEIIKKRNEEKRDNKKQGTENSNSNANENASSKNNAGGKGNDNSSQNSNNSNGSDGKKSESDDDDDDEGKVKGASNSNSGKDKDSDKSNNGKNDENNSIKKEDKGKDKGNSNNNKNDNASTNNSNNVTKNGNNKKD